MRDRDYFRLQTEHFTIEGRSRAGHESWFRVRDLGIALDIGRCPDAIIGVANVFITHAHLDHAAGIPFYAGQRRLQRLPAGNLFVPTETVHDFRTLMDIHTRLENTPYDVEFIGMAPGDTRRLSRTLAVRAHQATHRVAARGYEFLARRHHLRPEYAGIDGQELARLRYEGVAIDDEVKVPVLFYTGDTDRGILEQNEALFKAEVLMIECSFVADGHQERAATYRHIHFDDLADFAAKFENRVILLTHFSKRYAPAEVVEELRRRCPPVLRDRIRLAFPEPWERL
jgi:ribonuclease Z